MNTFKMKPLTAAIIAAHSSLGVAGAANAVHVNPDGLGQVLLFPYYTARFGQLDLAVKVDKGSTNKTAKVRFLEGRNSQEVIDFNLFLSPQDVWTGAVVANVQPAVHDLPMAILTSKDIGKIDQYTHAFNVTKDITPILVLSNPREEAKIPTEEEISNLIKGKTLEGYFPI